MPTYFFKLAAATDHEQLTYNSHRCSNQKKRNAKAQSAAGVPQASCCYSAANNLKKNNQLQE